MVTVVEGRVAILGIPDNGSARHANEGHPSEPKHEGEQGLRNPALRAAVADAAQREGGGAIFLSAGEQITVSPKTVRRTLHPNLAGATSWTQRQLVFDSASFADVAEEFNRYNERKLVIDASALDTLHISGVFSSTDPASLIRFLRDRPGLRVTETPTEIRVEEDP
jgi:transmembrane sensor